MSRASVTVTPSNCSSPAQQVAQDRGGQAGRQVGVLAGQREVTGHHQPRARVQCRSERNQLPFGQLGVRPRHQRQRVVRISCRVAGAREVLDGRGHAVALQAADGRRREPSDRLGIVAEAADPERRIGRVVGHVAHRRVVHVDAEGTQLAGRRAGDALGQLLVAGRAERHRARELRRPVAQADQLAALLVGGDQQRWCAGRACRLDGVGQPADLGRIDDVVGGKSVTPATPCSGIRLAADGGSSVPTKAIMSRASVTT